jgi:hypothetical protein
MLRAVQCVVTLSVSLFAQGIVAQVGKAVAGNVTPRRHVRPLDDKGRHVTMRLFPQIVVID